MLDSLPLPGTPQTEVDRRAAWLKPPHRVRSAIRRLHGQFGHCPNRTLIQILKTGRAAPEYLEAAKLLKFDACEETKPQKALHSVAPPKPYTFNFEIGVDCLEVSDHTGKQYTLLNIVCVGTCFQVITMVREGSHMSPEAL